MDAKIGLGKDMLNNVVLYFRDIGADKNLPTNKMDLYDYLCDFHRIVAVNNPLWPEDMSFGFVYAAFFNAILYDSDVELKGHNPHAHVDAFRDWITQGGVRENLRESWLRNNPDQRPKELAGREESEETKQIIADGYVDAPPSEVKKLIDKLEDMHGTMEAVIGALDNDNANSFRRRLYNTKQKYIDEDRWPE